MLYDVYVNIQWWWKVGARGAGLSEERGRAPQ